MKKTIKIIFTAAVVFSLCFPFSSCTKMSEQMKVTVYDVGKADSILLQTDNHTVLIDCGTKKKGDNIVRYLSEQGIDTIDSLIITHYDQDHIGGVPDIMKNLRVDNIYMPDYVGYNKEYDKFIESVDANSFKPETMKKDASFSYDGIKFQVLVPRKDTYGEPGEEVDNDYSLITTVKYDQTSFLFTGDAMKERLEEVMNIGHFDVLKVPYHGRKIGNLDDFLDEVTPKYAVVSTNKQELSKQTYDQLSERNIESYFTFANGDVVFTSDGKNITVETEKNKSVVFDTQPADNNNDGTS